MNVGYTLITKDHLDKADGRTLHNGSSSPSHVPSLVEGATLFAFAVLGGLGNLFVMIVTLTCPKFRRMSSAFLFHHCLLDGVKSVFCVPFGYSLLMADPIPHCDVLGAAYMLLMTVSAYNILALLLNEEYQCTYAATHRDRAPGDTCCIVFGIVIIWFTTVLLHLGVAFLPGSSEFSADIGNCVYRYGVTKNYVIHALWVVLVTGAVIVAAGSFLHFYRKLVSRVQTRKWTLLHKSLSSVNNHHHQPNNHPLTTTMPTSVDNERRQRLGEGEGGEEVHYQFEDNDTTPRHQSSSHKATTLQIQNYLRRLVVLFCMLVSFVVCWYPLFLLTLFDPHYEQSAHLYRVLTILAWVNPLTTPVFCAVIYYGQSWTTSATGCYRDVYTNAIPMTVSKSSHTSQAGNNGHDLQLEDSAVAAATDMLSFHNQNFHWGSRSSNHVDGEAARMEDVSVLLPPVPTRPHCEEGRESYCRTIANYNIEEEEGHTLIM